MPFQITENPIWVFGINGVSFILSLGSSIDTGDKVLCRGV